MKSKSITTEQPTSTEIKPYAYTPFTIPLTRHTLSDGKFEYRRTGELNQEAEPVNIENLFDLIGITHENFETLIETMPDDFYNKYGYIFRSLLQNITGVLNEAQHYVEENIGTIQVVTLARNSYMARAGGVVDAMLKEVQS